MNGQSAEYGLAGIAEEERIGIPGKIQPDVALGWILLVYFTLSIVASLLPFYPALSDCFHLIQFKSYTFHSNCFELKGKRDLDLLSRLKSN